MAIYFPNFNLLGKMVQRKTALSTDYRLSLPSQSIPLGVTYLLLMQTLSKGLQTYLQIRRCAVLNVSARPAFSLATILSLNFSLYLCFIVHMIQKIITMSPRVSNRRVKSLFHLDVSDNRFVLESLNQTQYDKQRHKDGQTNISGQTSLKVK